MDYNLFFRGDTHAPQCTTAHEKDRMRWDVFNVRRSVGTLVL
jgi:hypothetical protein